MCDIMSTICYYDHFPDGAWELSPHQHLTEDVYGKA